MGIRFRALALAMLAVAGTAAAQTADEIVANAIRARGGLEKIKAVRSLRMTGTLALGADTMPTVLELARPGKLRWEFTIDGITAVQAADGTSGWQIMPFEGQTEPEPLTGEALTNLRRQADLDGPLVDYRAKGNRVELVGKETADGREAWKLKVATSGGEERLVFIDASTWLQFKTVAKKNVGGSELEIESRIGDYRDVGGVMLPHSFESKAAGVEAVQSMKFDRIERDVPMDDSRFKMPAPKPTAPSANPTPSAG